MSLTDVCRLCLTKDNLVWIFDKRFENRESMKDVISITTGVEIHIKDIISQKICKKCCQVTIKMFEFRRTSLKNDQQLREECKNILKATSIKIPNTDVTIKSDIKPKHDEVKNESKPEVSTKPVFKLHPSVRDLFRIYPQIKLPTLCLSSHIKPFVSMPMDDVENYFKERKLDINHHTKLVLKSCRKVATKKTTTARKPNTTNCSVSNNTSATNIVSSKNVNKDNVIGPIRTKMVKSNFGAKASDSCVTNTDDTASNSKITDITNKSDVKVINIDLTKSTSSKETPEERANRKRKYPETDASSTKQSHKKPNLIESLGLTPKFNNQDAANPSTECPALSYVANTSVPLHICTMCNSVQYSAKDLRRHQTIKHLRCQFCKTKFRTLETKTKHIENTCPIKNMMNNLPDVQLKKIEYSKKTRRKYPDAFTNFPPLKNTSGGKDKSSSTKNIGEASRKDISGAGTFEKIKPDTTHKDKSRKNNSKKIKYEIPRTAPIDTGEIIEIISDDEESPSASTNVTSVDTSVAKTVTNQDNSKNNVDAAAPNTVIDQPSHVTPAPTIPSTLAPIPENVVYNTVSIVKPDIKIKNDNLLETIESMDPKLTDVKVLKELLKAKPMQLFAEKNTQMKLPTNDSICINRSDSSSELKKLKQQLYVFKIPIIIKNGKYKVAYNHRTDAKQPKKLCLWNDLTPIDIKTITLRDPAADIPSQIINDKSNNQETSHGSSLLKFNNNVSEEKSKTGPAIISENSNIQPPIISENTNIQPPIISENRNIQPPIIGENSNIQPPIISENSNIQLPIVSQNSNIQLPIISANSNIQPPIISENSNIQPQIISENSNIQPPIISENSNIQPPIISENSNIQSPIISENSNIQAQIISENSNIQATNTLSILPSTATYNFPGVQSSCPQEIAATPSRFVCVNTSVSSTPNGPTTTSIIDMNPMLNTILEPPGTTSCVTETHTSRPVSTSTDAEEFISDTPIPLGFIRIKEVWELC